MSYSTKRLQTMRGFYRNHIQKFYEDTHKAKAEGKSIAWVTSTSPVEIIHAMDIIPAWPENYASVCAAKQVSVRLCEAAEREGFSRDLCSYARCVIGSMSYEKKDLPLGGLPEPDFLVATNGACDIHTKWFQFISEKLNRSMFVLDMRYNLTGAEKPESGDVKHYVSELEELILFLEEQTGRKFDWDKLRDIERLSDHTSKLWMEIQDYRKNIPTPMSARDAFSAIFFMLCVPGTQMAVEFYERLCNELRDQVENKIGVIENESYRFVWDNLPMWNKLGFFDYLNSLGAVVVAETFSHIWAGDLDVSKPLESLARKYLPNPSNSDPERKIDLISNLVKNYKVDGVILPTIRGCIMMSAQQLYVKDVLQEKHGIPCLIIDIDQADWRKYNESQIKTELKTFVEMLR